MARSRFARILSTLMEDGTLPPETLSLLEEQWDVLEASLPTGDAERYDDRGFLARGGMGEVRRVWDARLQRQLVRKTLRPGMPLSARNRFVSEALLTARLEHPGVVPIHDFGVDEDGVPWFTMKEVQGQTMQEVVAALHAASPPDRWGTAPGGWGLKRLVDALLRVSQAIAFAHVQGVLHRDIKPDNLMLGAFGEVQVLDWGLACLQGSAEPDAEGLSDADPQGLKTRAGAVLGTPAFMPPEQARGEPLDERADVYALGATLYYILAGRPPHTGTPGQQLQALRAEQPPVPLARACSRPIPEELATLCAAAMSARPQDRLPSAHLLAQGLSGWLDGVQRREKARAVLAQAQQMLPDIQQRQTEAAAAAERAAALGKALASYAPVSEKAAAWAAEDEAASLSEQVELMEIEFTQVLRAALTHDPDLDGAHRLLADVYQRRHAQAEARRDASAMRRNAALLRAHDRGRHAAYLQGDGALTLLTDPPGARVELFRYVLRERRLQPEPFATLESPVRAHPLPEGSYLALLHAPGRESVRYPIHIGRQEHWSGTPPGESAPKPVWLPPAGMLRPEERYVPAGWFWSGGAQARNGLPRRRVWVDGLVIQRDPVTNEQMLAFLNDLVASGREDEALRHQLIAREEGPDPAAQTIYGRDASGFFFLKPDAQGDLWDPQWPVVLIDWTTASAWCAWYAAQTGRAWRLPMELEREKAVRGVDGRRFPWGDHQEPTWFCNRLAVAGRPVPARVSDYPFDESVYGVRGGAGNVRDMCLDRFRADGPPLLLGGRLPPPDLSDDGEPQTWRSLRGGAWSGGPQFGDLAYRTRAPQDFPNVLHGFRAACSIDAFMA